MPRIDEPAKRLPAWRPGHRVTIQGQDWHLRLPELVVSPVITDGHVGDVRVGPARVPDYDRLLAILYGEERVKPREYWTARFTAAAALIQGNYDLTDSELTELLQVTDGDQAGEQLYETITAVFAGELPDPKPAPADSPPPQG